MFETIKYRKDMRIATPDKILVPEWNVNLRVERGAHSVIMTYLDFKLYIMESTHPTLYRRLYIEKPGFDIRIWSPYDYLTFWVCNGERKNTVVSWFKDMQKKIETGDYSTGKDYYDARRIGLTSLTFFFMGIIGGEKYVIKSDWDGFVTEDFELADTSVYRIFLPLRKQRKNKSRDKAIYDETCNFWKNKIGNMDIAQWHLLMYEE